MTISLIVFFLLAAVAVLAALGMLLSRNAVYSALFLILNFITVAIFYLMLNAPFISIAQITVYAGAIMVLFLFVIMLLGAEKLPQNTSIRWQYPAAVVLGVLLALEFGYVLVFQIGGLSTAAALPANFGDPKDIGGLLFNQYLLPFEVTSILLLVAMVGVIVITKGDKTTR